MRVTFTLGVFLCICRLYDRNGFIWGLNSETPLNMPIMPAYDGGRITDTMLNMPLKKALVELLVICDTGAQNPSLVVFDFFVT